MNTLNNSFCEYDRIKKSGRQLCRFFSTVRDRSEFYRPSVRKGDWGDGLEINEKLIQYLWSEQLLKNASLRTAGGEILRIVFPGIWNQVGGPDFKQARLEVNGKTAVGDIEIHCYASGWLRHGHDRDPQYNQVILHVAFWNDRREKFVFNTAGQKIHQLILSPWLNKKYEEFDRLLSDHLFYGAGFNKISGGLKSGRAYRRAGGVGKCYAYFLKRSPQNKAGYFINLAAQVRLLNKINKFRKQLENIVAGEKSSGSIDPSCELLLYEGIMEALGYQSNRLAFLEVARRIPYGTLREIAGSFPPELKAGIAEAVLLWTAGLLPPELRAGSPETVSYQVGLNLIIRQLEKIFPRIISGLQYNQQTISWSFKGVRPVNFPSRRLAGAAYFLSRVWNGRGLMSELTEIFEKNELKMINKKIRELFCPGRDDYWLWHSTFGSGKFRRKTALVGPSLIDIILLNVIVPVLFLYAEKKKKSQLADKLLLYYTEAPPLAGNHLTAFMHYRLMGNNNKIIKRFVPTAGLQQGLLQIFYDFCIRGWEGCQDCGFLGWLHRPQGATS